MKTFYCTSIRKHSIHWLITIESPTSYLGVTIDINTLTQTWGEYQNGDHN